MNSGLICIPLVASTIAELNAKVRQADKFADIIELRVDGLEPNELYRLLDDLPETHSKLLITFRPEEQGGLRPLSRTQRLGFWRNALTRLGAAMMIDIESDIADQVPKAEQIRIVSKHDFSGEISPIEMAESIPTKAGDVVKVAISTSDIVDGIEVFKLIGRSRSSDLPVIPIAMGEAGKWTRILGPAHGAFMTFASLNTDMQTADGQISVSEMIDVYRIRELDRTTGVYGVIGDPVSSSISPFVHNAAFAAAGVNAVFLHLQVTDLDQFMRRMVRSETREVQLNFAGFSVTMPHKQAVMRHLDEIDPVAREIGAVNTVRIENDKLTGYNTDAHGFVKPLKRQFGPVKNARVAVFGAGGAARACCYSLLREGARATLFVRNTESARSLADQYGLELYPIPNVSTERSKIDLTGFDLVVDATPVGMAGNGDEGLFTSEQLLGVRFVYDLVTSPSETPTMLAAKAAGIPAIGGLEMLIAQAEKQFELWTGLEAPADVMRSAAISRIEGGRK